MIATGKLACRLFFVWFAAAAVMAAPSPKVNPGPPHALREYRLRLHHTHTGEWIDVVYRRGDSYIPEAMPPLNKQVMSGKVAYHIRDGAHNMLLKDWNWFMDLADVVLR